MTSGVSPTKQKSCHIRNPGIVIPSAVSQLIETNLNMT